MPKVGEECEYRWGCQSKWCKDTVSAYSGNKVWLSKLGVISLVYMNFRPIKTQKERVIEKCVIAINDGGCTNNIEQAQRIAERLYKNGMLIEGGE
jgi:hypothetical protein